MPGDSISGQRVIEARRTMWVALSTAALASIFVPVLELLELVRDSVGDEAPRSTLDRICELDSVLERICDLASMLVVAAWL